MLDGKSIVVRLRSQPAGREDARRQGIDEDAKLYVSHMPQHWDESTLRELFAPYGQVRDVRVIYDKETGRSKGYSFVAMASVAQA